MRVFVCLVTIYLLSHFGIEIDALARLALMLALIIAFSQDFKELRGGNS